MFGPFDPLLSENKACVDAWAARAAAEETADWKRVYGAPRPTVADVLAYEPDEPGDDSESDDEEDEDREWDGEARHENDDASADYDEDAETDSRSSVDSRPYITWREFQARQAKREAG